MDKNQSSSIFQTIRSYFRKSENEVPVPLDETTELEYCQLLGVDRAATINDLKHAFRTKARVLHPNNKAGGDSEAFTVLAAAYSGLMKAKKAK